MDPFFQDERKMTSNFGNIAGVGFQDYSKPLENPQFSEDAPVLRNDRRKTNQVNIFDPFEQLNKRYYIFSINNNVEKILQKYCNLNVQI